MGTVRESSRLAHEEIKPSKNQHYIWIKEAMKKVGRPAISKMIAEHCPELGYHAVARRLSEMRNKGMVKETGRDNTIKYSPVLWDLN